MKSEKEIQRYVALLEKMRIAGVASEKTLYVIEALYWVLDESPEYDQLLAEIRELQ